MFLEGNAFYTIPSTFAVDIQLYSLPVLKKINCCVVCMQVEVSTDPIKTLSHKKKIKILYFEVLYEITEEAASAPSCRQHIIEPAPQTQRVNQAEAQYPQAGADSWPAAKQCKSALSPCSELVAEQQQGLTAL